MAVIAGTHLNLEQLAVRLINAGEAAHIVPHHEIMTRAEQVRRVTEYLRGERLRVTDAEFRRTYAKHF